MISQVETSIICNYLKYCHAFVSVNLKYIYVRTCKIFFCDAAFWGGPIYRLQVDIEQNVRKYFILYNNKIFHIYLTKECLTF